jgi:hypothetical protein
MLNPFQPFVQILKSKTRRRIGTFFLLAILLSIVFDFLDGIKDSNLTVFWGTVGGGGGAIFLGINLLRFLPDHPAYRWQYGLLAIIWIFGGLLGFIFGLASIWLY